MLARYDRRQPALLAKTAFTLVELLVVIAIISILAAMLLPVLGQARQQARRSTCLSNLKQLHLCAVMYNDSWGGHLPTNFTSWDNAWSAEDALWEEYAFIDNNPNGWHIFWKSGAVPESLLACPSAGMKPLIWDCNPNGIAGLVNYGYRYNNCVLASNYKPHALADANRGWRPLFHDPVSYRSTMKYTWHTATNPKNIWTSKRKWAHNDGGNAINHGGAGRWYINAWDTQIANSGWSQATCWPAVDWHKALYHLDLGGGTYGGLDEVVRRQR